MRQGGFPVWAAVLSGLFFLGGAWLLVNGLACSAALSSLPSSPTSPNGLSSLCSTYETGGIGLIVVAFAVISLALVFSRRGRSSGRAIGSRKG